MKKWIGIGLGVVVLVGVVLLTTVQKSEDGGQKSAPEKLQPQQPPTGNQQSTTSPPKAPESAAIDNLRPQIETNGSVSSLMPTASILPTVDAETLRIVGVLKKSYVPGGLPIQIKYQDELSRYWEKNPPSAGAMVALVSDQSAPAELRVYFAKALANMMKVNAFSAADTQEALGELRAIVSGQGEVADFRADLANVLTRVDGSSEAVKAVVPLLSEDQDEVAVKAVAALTHTTNESAIDAVYEFVQDCQTLLDEKPMALMAALGPLATTTNDITPVVNHIFETTDDFRLYAGAVQCLFYAQSSDEVMNAIAGAYTASKHFTAEQLQAESICQAAAKKHTAYYQKYRNEFDPQIITIIDGLLRGE